MNYSIKSKVWASIIAIFISGLFLWFVLNPPSVFNMLPFAIHPGGASESTFIIVFDVIIALLLFVLSYRITYKQIIKK